MSNICIVMSLVDFDNNNLVHGTGLTLDNVSSVIKNMQNTFRMC